MLPPGLICQARCWPRILSDHPRPAQSPSEAVAAAEEEEEAAVVVVVEE